VAEGGLRKSDQSSPTTSLDSFGSTGPAYVLGIPVIAPTKLGRQTQPRCA